MAHLRTWGPDETKEHASSTDSILSNWMGLMETKRLLHASPRHGIRNCVFRKTRSRLGRATYELFVRQGESLVFLCRARRHIKSSSFIISTNLNQEEPVAHVTCNFLGTLYTLRTGAPRKVRISTGRSVYEDLYGSNCEVDSDGISSLGSSRGSMSGSCGEDGMSTDSLPEEIGFLKFGPLNNYRVRPMSLGYLQPEPDEARRWCPVLEGKDLFEAYTCGCAPDNLVIFESRIPTFSEKQGFCCLDFFGRDAKGSSRNCQFFQPAKVSGKIAEEDVTLLFYKLAENEYELEFREPIIPLVAMMVAIARQGSFSFSE
eukprot:Rmarinus@m.18266